jgi:replicative DNA helicase
MDGSRDVSQLRVPPHSVEAEQAVLGGILLVSRALDEVSGIVDEASFYRRDHQLIWRALKALSDHQRPIDVVTVGDFLCSKGFADEVQGGAYIVELASTTPSAANIRAYAEIVADKARLRALIEVGTGLVNAGFQPEGRESVEIIGEAQTAVAGLLNSQPCELEPIARSLQQAFDDLVERHNRGGGIEGLTTGFDDLDTLLNGLSPGLYVLAARPKNGKTTMAANIAEHVALVRKQRVAIFSLEMQGKAIANRMLSSVGDVDADRIRRGELDDADWANVTAAIRKLRGADIVLSKPKNARVEHICAQARREHGRSKLGLIVIDYLQLIHAPGDNRAQAVGEVSRMLSLLSHELGVPVLLLSQLNRELEKRDDKRPRPSDLRDSGSIEQDADAVIFIYRDELYNANSRWKGTAEILVPLQRNGPAGELRILYRPDRFRFENLPTDWEPAPLPEGEGKSRRRGFRKGGNAGADAAAGDA